MIHRRLLVDKITLTATKQWSSNTTKYKNENGNTIPCSKIGISNIYYIYT